MSMQNSATIVNRYKIFQIILYRVIFELECVCPKHTRILYKQIELILQDTSYPTRVLFIFVLITVTNTLLALLILIVIIVQCQPFIQD